MSKASKRGRAERARKTPEKAQRPAPFVRDADLKEAAREDALGGADLEHCMRMRG